MNQLEIIQAAKALQEGRAIRSATVRHRRLHPKPLAVVLWQLGAEPFSAAALGWGRKASDFHLRVCGEPRNRQLAFNALLEFARWFNPLFETPSAEREAILRGRFEAERATDAPQIICANKATVKMLERLGRRLAYLPLDGEWKADPALVRLGQHLQFIGRHAGTPGQQLIVPMTDLVGDHWVTPQSSAERQSLAALDAWVEPPAGLHGYEAAALAERYAVGPLPGGDDDERLDPLVQAFNTARGGETDDEKVMSLLGPIRGHFAPMTKRTWDLIWRCRARELELDEASSVEGRWALDLEAYTRHMDWVAKSGRRRTRQTARQAARTLRDLEQAKSRLEAEEACDDPLRMAPYVLDNKAVRGRVVSIDRAYSEVAKKRAAARPLLTLDSPDECVMPVGKELWWSEASAGPTWEVHAIRRQGEGSRVVLKLMTSSAKAEVPAIGAQACFSVHSTADGFMALFPEGEPWTHVPAAEAPVESIEAPEGAGP